MKPLDRRFAFALLLLTVATAAGAAQVDPANESVDAWAQSLGQPEGFTRMADGSLERKALAGGPGATIPETANAARAHVPLRRGTAEDFHREAPEVPAMTSAYSPAPTPTRRSTEGLPLAAGLTAAAGVCLFLILNGEESVSHEGFATAVAPSHAPAPVVNSRVADFLLDEPVTVVTAPVSARLPERPRNQPYLDTRMPVATWRAIARQEQALIERWNASADKAAGRASFEQWLDAQGPTPGVDATLLKAKLARA
jgi:hypothetical protein